MRSPRLPLLAGVSQCGLGRSAGLYWCASVSPVPAPGEGLAVLPPFCRMQWEEEED